ncbi:DUF6879 family protein [Streptomyces sp. NPDC001941]|uniref:DUF6879 family protein n=1 Tax=Streptomyces sp. NPDC001941 TaxID=3154659 RepID=UPI003334868B
MTISPADFDGLFETFGREAFRLETLDDYSGSSDPAMIRAFLAGEPRPADYNQSWADEVRAHVESGRRVYRVHVLTRPLTDYLRFELGWGYAKNQEAGEEFFVLDVTDGPNPVAGVPDFWMFDESRVVSMEYGEGGAFTGARERGDAAEWVRARDAALGAAVPFGEWWGRYGGA